MRCSQPLEVALVALRKDDDRRAALDEAKKLLQNAQRDDRVLQGLLRDGMQELEAIVAECVGAGADAPQRVPRAPHADARLLEQAVGVMARAADAACATAAVGRLPGGTVAAHSQAQLDHLQGALLHVVFAGAVPQLLTSGRHDTDGDQKDSSNISPLESTKGEETQSLAALAARCAAALRTLADSATASAPVAPPPQPPSSGGAPEPPPRVSENIPAAGVAAPDAAEGAGEVERWLADGALTIKTAPSVPEAHAMPRAPALRTTGPQRSGSGGSPGLGATRMSTGAGGSQQPSRGGTDRDVPGGGAISGASVYSSRTASARRVTFDATAPLSDDDEEDEVDSGRSKDDNGADEAGATAAAHSPLESALFGGDTGSPTAGEHRDVEVFGTRSPPRRTSSTSRRCAAELLRSGAGSRASRGSHGELVLSPTGKEMAPAGIARRQLSTGGGSSSGRGGSEAPWERDAFDLRDDGLTDGMTADEAAELQRSALTAAWLRNCVPLAAAALPCAAAAATAAAASARAAAATAAEVVEDPFHLQLQLLRSISPGAASPTRRSSALAHHLQHQQQQQDSGLPPTDGGAVNASSNGAAASPPRGPWGSSAGGAPSAGPSASLCATTGCATSLTSTLTSTGAMSAPGGSPRRRGARYCRIPPNSSSCGMGGVAVDSATHQQAVNAGGPESAALLETAAQLLEALAALGRDERFHPAIMEATHRGAELAALLGLTREGRCSTLEEPLVRLVAALACLGDDATRHALIDTGAVDILIHQLLHRVSGPADGCGDLSTAASIGGANSPLLGPCVSVCLGALASLGLVSNCAKQLMVARRLPHFLSRVMATAEAAAVAANAAGELPPAGAAAADLLAVLQEGVAGGALLGTGSPYQQVASANGCDAAVGDGAAHICIAPHPRVAAAAAAVAAASSPRTPNSTPVAAVASGAGMAPGGALNGSPLQRMHAVSSSGGVVINGSWGGGEEPRGPWGSGAGVFPVPDPAAIERGVAELATRVRVATLSDPRTQAPRHALDEKLSGSRWAALSALALSSSGGCAGANRAPANNISIVAGGALGSSLLLGPTIAPGATPFNSPAPCSGAGALGSGCLTGGASPCASLTSTMRLGGTGTVPSLHNTLKSSGALAAALGGATPYNSPLRASEGGGAGALIGAGPGTSTLQRMLAAQHQQQAGGGGMVSAFSTLSLATPSNSPAAGLHGSGRYGALQSMRPSSAGAAGTAAQHGEVVSALLASSLPPRCSPHSMLRASVAGAAPGSVWGSDCGALNVTAAEDHAGLPRSSMGGAKSPMRPAALTTCLQAMHAGHVPRASTVGGASVPHVDSLLCPSLLSPYGGGGAPRQHEASSSGAGVGNAPAPCGRCGRLMSNCCHCSAAGAVPGSLTVAAAAAVHDGPVLRTASSDAVEVSRALFGSGMSAAGTPCSGSSRRSGAAAAACGSHQEDDSGQANGSVVAAAFPVTGGALAAQAEVQQDDEGSHAIESAYPPIDQLNAALRFSLTRPAAAPSSAQASTHSESAQQEPAEEVACNGKNSEVIAALGLTAGDFDISGATDLQDLAARLGAAAASGGDDVDGAAVTAVCEPAMQSEAGRGKAAAAGATGSSSARRQVGMPAEEAGPYELEESDWAEGQEAAYDEEDYPTVFI